ncbi:hypothetical protein [Gulosibacter sp. 10]|uniref:hypothetical protein n=1 Tax=Gulosibacter sp. 10 TaxID=1255570 RepID=UPI00097F0DF9|nr:hypothetical protein [Gulosibacter sp. 10]SJM55457.1 hypothetical protein FM112_04075 [Gulosibacter sp. 10]
MSQSSPAAEIRTALLTSAYVGEVLQVQVEQLRGAQDEITISSVGVRASIVNVSDLNAVPPLLAELRSLVRGVAGADTPVFVEPDFTEPSREDVPTESIVIRSWD